MANMDAMQQEAMRRVQEMQARAQQFSNSQTNKNTSERGGKTTQNSSNKNKQKDNRADKNGGNKAFEKEKAPCDECEQSIRDNKPCHTHKRQNLVDILMEDKERNLILLLIILLSSEGVNPSVLLALMYLVL